MAAKEYRHRAMTWGVQAAYYTALPIWLLNCWGVVTIADMLSMVSTEMVNTEDKHQAMLDLAYLYENMIMRNRSCCTFVIHCKIKYSSISVNRNSLNVLTTDINNRLN